MRSLWDLFKFLIDFEAPLGNENDLKRHRTTPFGPHRQRKRLKVSLDTSVNYCIDTKSLSIRIIYGGMTIVG